MYRSTGLYCGVTYSTMRFPFIRKNRSKIGLNSLRKWIYFYGLMGNAYVVVYLGTVRTHELEKYREQPRVSNALLERRLVENPRVFNALLLSIREKTHLSFFEVFTLCLSRACLGKPIIFVCTEVGMKTLPFTWSRARVRSTAARAAAASSRLSTPRSITIPWTSKRYRSSSVSPEYSEATVPSTSHGEAPSCEKRHF